MAKFIEKQKKLIAALRNAGNQLLSFKELFGSLITRVDIQFT